jgi:hypothetical protein
MGAAVASAISKFIHWFLLRRYYHRYLRESGEERAGDPGRNGRPDQDGGA